jgi:hypothetical protein
MWEWLFSPIDATRAHDIAMATAWHGRAMVLAWGVLAPLSVIIARYFKVMPGQDWPHALDNQIWWRCHWIGQVIVLGLSIIGLILVLPLQIVELSTHGILGCLVLVALAIQVALGLLRGSKGGPTATAPDGSLRGDHYDMTPRRRWFEVLHKAIGYSVLVLAGVTILYGLIQVNGVNWIWVLIVLWWLCLGAVCVVFQRKKMAVGSYQAIWGEDPKHPGNAPNKEEQEPLRTTSKIKDQLH